MSTYTFNEVRKRFKKLIEVGGEPELSLYMYGKEYMIIGYDDSYSFQRCGSRDGSGEFFYSTLDELYNAVTVDNILLSRDWDDITDFHCSDYGWDDEDVLYDEQGRQLW